jgi:tRNA-(ms[2]io[6]A)-hydroxylase
MRRLPVIQDTASDDAQAADRPRWQWAVIGAGFTATLWAPLALVAAPLGVRLGAAVARVAPEDLVSGVAVLSERQRVTVAVLGAAPLLLVFAVAAALAGGLVGRFGGRSGRREAALGGLIAALGLSSLAIVAGPGLPLLSGLAAFGALAPVGAVSGLLGGVFGVRKRPC